MSTSLKVKDVAGILDVSEALVYKMLRGTRSQQSHFRTEITPDPGRRTCITSLARQSQRISFQ